MMEIRMNRRATRNVRGFTLLEVLIALLIFSLGLLGLAGLMVVSVKTNQSAYLRTQASFLAQSMADRMRANIAVIDEYETTYDESTEGDASCEDVACAPAALAANDRAVWSRQLVTQLPRNATASIECEGASLGLPATAGAATYDGLCTFIIQWNETRLERTDDPDEMTAQQTFAWVFQP
jgi:type IV pilus assembly protein PilV